MVLSLEVTFLPGGSVLGTLSGLLFMSCQCHRENYSFGILLHPAGSWPFEWCWQPHQLVRVDGLRLQRLHSDPKIPNDSSSCHISASLHWVHALKHQRASSRLLEVCGLFSHLQNEHLWSLHFNKSIKRSLSLLWVDAKAEITIP